MYLGYTGKLLHIDLSSRSTREDDLEQDLCRLFIGGNGFAARLLYDLMRPGVDPFSPENTLVFATGPVNGTAVPMASKFCVAGKSPLSLGWMDSFCGGRVGTELKYAGYDAVTITGKSEDPTVIFIDDGDVRFVDARDVWGKRTSESQTTIKRLLGDESIAVATIGPAGENLARCACIISDSRAAGTGGLGAVMGSKNLKAIAARGTKTIPIAHLDRLRAFIKKVAEKAKTHPGGRVLSTFGTSAGLGVLQQLGALPSRNWQTEINDYAEEISGETLREQFVKKDISCPSCLVPSGNYAVVKCGKYAGASTIGPEYEGQYALGTIVGNACPEALIAADRLTDELGLGQISAGVTIAFAMECFERGYLTTSETDGIELRFGNHEALLTMLEKMAYRQGIGDLLAEGVKRASEALGPKTEDFAMHVKGIELPGHSPRAVKSVALGYAVGNRGATHCDVRPAAEESGVIDRDIKDKGVQAKELSDWTCVANSLVWCLSAERVLGLKISEDIAEMLNVITDMGVDVAELTRIGERVNLMERCFNIREGFRRKDDTLPKRIMEEPIPEGPSKGWVTPKEELDVMIDEYYAARGWDLETGIPLPETAEKLDLPDIAADLKGIDE